MGWDELTLAQKSELMKTYIKSGVTSLDDMAKHFNSYAKGGPKKTFEQWKQAMMEKFSDIEFDSSKAGYDYKRYFNENYEDAISRLTEPQARHFTDKYKLPNHPTFSNESVYSQGPMIGGRWTHHDTFVPSMINRQQYPLVYRQDRPYTEEEIYDRRDNPNIAVSEPAYPDLKPIDLATMFKNNPAYGQNRRIDTTMLRAIDNTLRENNLGLPQRQAVAFSIQQEGNTTGSHGNGAYGLVGWRGKRATPIRGKGLDEQAQYLYNTVTTYDPAHWSDGGKGSGFATGKDTWQAFMDAMTAEEAIEALNHGYIKPPKAERKFRINNVNGIFGIPTE